MMMHTLYTKLEWMRELLALDWLTFESDILCLTFGWNIFRELSVKLRGIWEAVNSFLCGHNKINNRKKSVFDIAEFSHKVATMECWIFKTSFFFVPELSDTKISWLTIFPSKYNKCRLRKIQKDAKRWRLPNVCINIHEQWVILRTQEFLTYTKWLLES